MFRDTKYLAPQRRIPTLFWFAPDFFERDLPQVYTARTQYRDENNRKFSEDCILDFEALRDTEIDDNPVTKPIADAIKELTKTVNQQRRL